MNFKFVQILKNLSNFVLNSKIIQKYVRKFGEHLNFEIRKKLEIRSKL
jgi:hypothetical protein